MVMYSIYNTETFEKLIDTVHLLQNITTPNENLFAGQSNTAYMWYINTHGTHVIGWLSYEKFLWHLRSYWPEGCQVTS